MTRIVDIETVTQEETTVLPTRSLMTGLRVGLLGGSFNPAHEGHREISITALRRLALDEVWWLVSPANPLKDPAQYLPYPTRLRRAQKIAAHPAIRVTDIEQRLGTRYTIDTLEGLHRRYSATRFIWLMGADSLATFHRWRDWRRIAATLPIAVFNRPGARSAAMASQSAQFLAAFRLPVSGAARLATHSPPAWVFFPAPSNPTSATALRNAGRKLPFTSS